MSTRNREDGRGPYIRTVSGRKLYLLEPSAEQIYIPDVARHLAGTNRFNGCGISVAQHCVVGARLASRFYPDVALLPARFMVHDVAEAYLGDVSSPLKRCLDDYKVLERDWDAAVEDRFDVLFVGVPVVKELDDRMWMTERLITQPMLSLADDYAGPLEEFPLEKGELEEMFTPWGMEVAEHEYLVALREHLPWIS